MANVQEEVRTNDPTGNASATKVDMKFEIVAARSSSAKM